MKIAKIDVYGYRLTYAHGDYVMSGGRSAGSQDSTVLRLTTEDGAEGWGESCSLGATYLPSFTGGTRAALAVLAPALLGVDPTNLSAVHRLMDRVMLGQNAPKSAVDVACWDLLGQQAGLPISALLGGALWKDFPLYEAVPLGPVASMVEFVRQRGAEGIRAFQVKVGNDPTEDAQRIHAVYECAGQDAVIVADANGGWNVLDAAIALRLIADLDVFVEQPCRSLEDCAALASRWHYPLVVDEPVTDPARLIEAKRTVGAAAVNIKIGRVGGLSSAARLRDLAQDLAMKVTVEDTWGGDITTAAVSHLAASTRPENLLTTSFFNDWTLEHVAGHQPRSVRGRGSAPTGPGLGISVDTAGLGEPLMSYR
ncbi:MAG: mandelate racemase/muconate lactonizing enzyme family protein [Microbacteriaceae bacterium]